MQKLHYERMSFQEREEISRGLAAGDSLRTIAKRIGRTPSTISREIGGQERQRVYRALSKQRQAQVLAASRRKDHRKILQVPALQRFIHRYLQTGWSPDQIAKTLKSRYPHERTMHVAPETIYAYIYVLPRGELKHSLIAGLRQERKYRRKRKDPETTETRGKLADMLSIEERPKEVADRTVPGHWEGDIILGKYRRSALGTLVERTTRLTLLVRLAAKDRSS